MVADAGSTRLGAWTVEIQYDATAMKVATCTGENGSLCNPDAAAGVIRITGASAAGLTGQRTLAAMSFEPAGKVARAQKPTLTIGTLTDAEGNPLAYTQP